MMRTNKTKNLHLFLSEIMRKLKHSFKKEKPQHDKRLSGKKRRFERILSTKDHFFLERMTSISEKRSHKQLHDNQKHPSHEMLNNGDFDQNLATSEEPQTRIVPLPERNQTVDDISKVEACNGEKETSHEESLPPPSHYVSKAEEYNLILEPLLFIGYEISPVRCEAKREPLCNQLQEGKHPMDQKESVFEYVKAVLGAMDLNWEELYLRTEFCDQLLNPALISNIPFYPSQLCVDHELLFDCINEVLFESCRFPQWVSSVKPRTQVFSISIVQKEVYCRLFPSQFPHSLDQIVRQDMAKPRNWLDIRCDLACIGFETSQLILDELFQELMLDLTC